MSKPPVSSQPESTKTARSQAASSQAGPSRPLVADVAAATAEATVEATAEGAGRLVRAGLVVALFVLWVVLLIGTDAVRLVHLPLVGGVAGAILFALNRRRRDLFAFLVGAAACLVSTLTWTLLPLASMVSFSAGTLLAIALVSFELVEAAVTTAAG